MTKTTTESKLELQIFTKIKVHMHCASEFLQGAQLSERWIVRDKIQPTASSTGGSFSVPYIVESTQHPVGQHAFLKALSLRRILESGDIGRALETHTRAFNFERDTLALCKASRLRRVATILDSGQYQPPNNSLPVLYLIFEIAKGGDARRQLDKLPLLNLAWTLRTLHSITVGLKELHTHGIAHQDLKPSNILFFESFGAKIADLGCADRKIAGHQSPRGHLNVPGGLDYAPPELSYGECSLDWDTRRIGCDLYLLGNLVLFFFTRGTTMTANLLARLNPSHGPTLWTRDYRSVLPYLIDAHHRTIAQIGVDIPESIRTELMQCIAQLCHPDPKLRGHPNCLSGNQFDLQRYVSLFDRLATRAEYKLI